MKKPASPNSLKPIKVGFWTKDDLNFSEKLDKATFTVTDEKMTLRSDTSSLDILYTSLLECELRQWHGVGTYIHLKTRENTVNFFIPRINIANWFVVNNYFKTQDTFKSIQEKRLGKKL